MFSSLGIASSGIRAAQTHLAITGHNISNSEIPGFSRQRIVQSTAFNRNVGNNLAGQRMQVGMGTDWGSVHQIRNEFLDISYRQNVGRLQFYSTMVQAGLVVEGLLGELHGAYNFQSVLNNMWSSIQELTANPSGIDTRQLFLATANSLIVKAQDVFTGLVEYQHNLDGQIRNMVAEINENVQRIADLNDIIRAAEASGDNANDFRDERNRLIDRLSEMVPLDTFWDNNGDVILISGGHTLLSQGFVNRLGLRFTSDEFGFVEPVFTNSREILSASTSPQNFIPFMNYSTPISVNTALRSDSGQLMALLVARGTVPGNLLSESVPAPADRQAYFLGIVNATEAVRDDVALRVAAATPGSAEHTAALAALETAQAALDAAINRHDNWVVAWHGADFAGHNLAPITQDIPSHQEVVRFRTSQQYNWEIQQWSIQNAKIPGVQMNLDRIVNSVATMINDALTGNLVRYDVRGNREYIFDSPPLDMNGNPGIPLFIRNSDASNVTWPFANQDSTSISTIFTINNIQINPKFTELNGHNLLALSLSGARDDNRLLLELQNIWMSPNSPYSVTIGERRFSVQDAYIRFTGNIATEISEAQNFVNALTVQTQQAESLRQSVKGVSMDEELNSMLRFQFAFQSAARVLNVIDSMIDQVVNRTGRAGL